MVTYPEKWRKVPLSEVADVRDGTHDSPQYVAYGYPLVTSKNLKKGKIDWSDIQYISKKDFDAINKRSKVDPNDILMGMIGTIGNIAMISKKCNFAIKNVALIKDVQKVNMLYLYYYLQSKNAMDQLVDQADGGNQKFIALNKIRNFATLLPSATEQEHIAKTLVCFDDHIDNLTELIEKKRNIRDGALEDLVSGRTRIDGFNDEWIEYSFDSFFTLMSNNTLSRDKLTNKGVVGNIHYGDVLIKYQNCLTNEDEIPYIKAGIDTKPFKQLHAGDVVIADTAEDETVGKAIQICDVSIPVVSGLHTIVCRPNYSTALGYLGYYINSRCYHDQFYPHITGIKVSSISKKAIKTTVLKIPRDIDEQKEIIHIIAAMDEEIKEMEKQRDKIIQIREGAMDDLLTGRVRLKV